MVELGSLQKYEARILSLFMPKSMCAVLMDVRQVGPIQKIALTLELVSSSFEENLFRSCSERMKEGRRRWTEQWSTLRQYGLPLHCFVLVAKQHAAGVVQTDSDALIPSDSEDRLDPLR
jgi:hypothetical protein